MKRPKEKKEGEQRTEETEDLGSGLRAGVAVFGDGLRVFGRVLGRIGTWLARENKGHWSSVLVQVGLASLVGYAYGVLR